MAITLPKTKYDWIFYAKSPNACKLSPNHSKKGCFMSRGKMLGGSSSSNFLAAVRGIEDYFNKWASLGNPGWDFKHVLPYFKKFENNLDPEIATLDNGKWHGTSGPVKIKFGENSALNEVLERSYRAAGVPFIDELNAADKLGFAKTQSFASNGCRSSSAEAYLIPAKDRRNFHVIKHAFVEKILINSNNKAYGVEFSLKKQKLRVYCRKEVIVSAGAIQSPPLLMRSGIGPKEHLQSHKIDVKADLPVGKNYIDHAFGHFMFTFNVSAAPLPKTLQLDALYQYLTNSSGAFAKTVPYLMGYVDSTGRNTTPDLLFFFTNYPRGTPKENIIGLARFFEYDQLSDMLVRTNQNEDISMLAITLIEPKFRGVIKLNKCSNCKKPLIYGNYLNNIEDRRRLIAGMKYIMRIIRSPPFQANGAKFLRIPIPACNSMKFEPDAYWDCYVQHLSAPGSHQCGTSKMGTDASAVVDPRCKVHRIDGLRQVDAGM